MIDTDATTPGADEAVHASSGNEVADDAATHDDGLDAASDQEHTDDDGAGDEVADDLEDFELDGKTYKVPKELKRGFLREADYTKKTQELAEQRKAVETRQAEIAQREAFQREHIQDFAKYEQIEGRIGQLRASHPEHLQTVADLRNTDWDQWYQIDPKQAAADEKRYLAARKAIDDYAVDLAQMEAERNTHRSQVQAKFAEWNSKAERENATRREQFDQALARDLKDDWTPQTRDATRQKLNEFGRSMGFSDEELNAIDDPRAMKVLHAAWKAQRQAQTAAARATLAAQQVAKPVPQVGGSAPAGKDPSRMSTAEWMRWRDQQTRQSRKGR